MNSEFFESRSYTPEMVNPQTFFKNTYCNFSFPEHFHDEHLIQIIKEGQNSFFCNGNTYEAAPGDVVLINPGEVHNGQSRTNEKLQYNVFYIDPGVWEEVLGIGSVFITKGFLFNKTLVKDELLFGKIDRFFYLLAEDGHDEIRLHEKYLDILLYISHHYSLSRSGYYNPDTHHTKTINLLKDYIQENLSNKLSLEDLSRAGNVSPFHLLRIFTKQTGLTLHQFILVSRIEKSKDLLKNKMAISDVAFTMGFADQSHFTRSFKKMMGLTPRQYQLCMAHPPTLPEGKGVRY